MVGAGQHIHTHPVTPGNPIEGFPSNHPVIPRLGQIDALTWRQLIRGPQPVDLDNAPDRNAVMAGQTVDGLTGQDLDPGGHG